MIDDSILGLNIPEQHNSIYLIYPSTCVKKVRFVNIKY